MGTDKKSFWEYLALVSVIVTACAALLFPMQAKAEGEDTILLPPLNIAEMARYAAGEQAPVYRNIIEESGEITADTLNVRTGPGLNYTSVAKLQKGDKIDLLCAIGNWYVLRTPAGEVGVASKEHIKVTALSKYVTQEGADDGKAPAGGSNADEVARLFGLINKARQDNQLSAFAWDERLNKVAELKAQDLTKNETLSHDSKAYGTPFEMLKNMGVSYKTASENVLSSISVDNAYLRLMESPMHRAGLLSARYNKMGVGIAESPKYGIIIVQMFVEE